MADDIVNVAEVVLFDCWNIDRQHSLHPPLVFLVVPNQLLELEVVLDWLEVECKWQAFPPSVVYDGLLCLVFFQVLKFVELLQRVATIHDLIAHIFISYNGRPWK